jgi:hypothetical protein
MKIVNDDSRVVNKLEASHADDARVVIYDRHMFIVQATEFKQCILHFCLLEPEFLLLIGFSSILICGTFSVVPSF